jgi:hypothetical protein
MSARRIDHSFLCAAQRMPDNFPTQQPTISNDSNSLLIHDLQTALQFRSVSFTAMALHYPSPHKADITQLCIRCFSILPK